MMSRSAWKASSQLGQLIIKTLAGDYGESTSSKIISTLLRSNTPQGVDIVSHQSTVNETH